MGQDTNKKAPAGKRPVGKGGGEGDRDMGSALRTVYQKTVEEEIPNEFLDLLGKLK